MATTVMTRDGVVLTRDLARSSPLQELGERPRVYHGGDGDSGEPSMRNGGVHVVEFRRAVSVSVEREETAGVERLAREVVVDVLPRRVAVDFDGDIRLLRRRKHARPVRHD